jgi:hypothetical protein
MTILFHLWESQRTIWVRQSTLGILGRLSNQQGSRNEVDSVCFGMYSAVQHAVFSIESKRSSLIDKWDESIYRFMAGQGSAKDD